LRAPPLQTEYFQQAFLLSILGQGKPAQLIRPEGNTRPPPRKSADFDLSPSTNQTSKARHLAESASIASWADSSFTDTDFRMRG
jgi:hypothetical protein